ncbi:ankyrin [Parathielavia hyrcaniae]|uniref:Ankyrin n=1 Tax=Parathielavia hyrcaniae TaxID=113614 RepID=A0AAN6PXI7_9PEZI|nr:ankyrin [Parathielavia hyrcaniae]
MPRQPRCPLDWAAHRSRIEDLYWIHDGKLREVMKIMADAHGFVATQKMYKKYLKDWGLEKNIKTRESIFMIGVAERRRMANKETVFTRHGKPVDLRKLYRFRRRHKLLRDGMTDPLLEAQVSTPPHITYRTPEPDPSTSLLPPQIQHYRDADTSEEDQVAMADSPVSYDIHSEGTPPICDIPWEQPLSVIWPSDETGSDAARPTPTATVAGFIPNAFCAHQMSASPNNLAPHDPSPTPFQTTWVDPTDPPSHGNYPSADGNSFWFLALERPHHAAHMATRELGLEVNGVSCLHSPSLSQVMLDINAFSYPGPTLPLSSGPEAARYAAQDHMALNDAVDKNDLDRVRSLLASGARPNSAACGGVTALHTAAAQGNVEMIKLLLSHGASLDAMTNKKQTVLFFVIRGPGNHLGLCDPLAFPHQSHANIPAPHTDDATVGVIEALFNSPTRWIHLRRSLDKVDQHGVSPLMLAAGRGLDKSAAMLLERGARPDLRDHAGHTALRYAARNQHRGLVRMLLLADPAVAEEGDLWHILKLASKNFAVRGHVPDGGVRWWDGGGHDGVSLSASNLIAEEMVRLCREMGVLDGLLRLAEQKRKRNVVGLLLGAMRRLDGDGSREGSST